MSYDSDLDAIASWDDEPAHRSTGPRRSEPAICYGCGREISDADVRLLGAFCSGACEQAHGRRPVDPWLVNEEVR